MTEWRESSSKSGETALLLDLSLAGNSAQACHLVDEFVERLPGSPAGVLVDINAGDLLLTRGVLSKIHQQILRAGASLGIVYATVPQTQQASLDEGLFVKEKPAKGWAPLRQTLPVDAPSPLPSTRATRPETPKMSTTSGKSDVTSVHLPDFSQSKSATPRATDFVAVAPQSMDIPELAEPEFETSSEPVENETLLPPVDGEALPVSGLTPPASLASATASPDSPQEVVYTDAALETLYWRQTLRSGQTIRFNGNIIIIGDVHAGSEITAGGDIVVWGELRGIAHAGAQGNYKSEIRAMKIEALQLRIADYIARRPDRIFYHKDGAEQVISPEVARVADGEIKIFKTTLSRS